MVRLTLVTLATALAWGCTVMVPPRAPAGGQPGAADQVQGPAQTGADQTAAEKPSTGFDLAVGQILAQPIKSATASVVGPYGVDPTTLTPNASPDARPS